MERTLGFYYNFLSVVDRKERPIRLVKFDKKTRTLLLPIINKTNNATNKYVHYTFNGQYFDEAR